MSIDRRDLARLILAATCWGVGTVISKAALAEFAPLSLLAVQLGSSLVVLALLLRAQRSPLLAGAPSRLSRLGLLNPGLAYALSLLGLVTITASLSVLLWALEPLLIVALAGVFLRERITPAFVALSLVAVAGMVVVLWDPGATGGELIGIALTVAGVACCAVYSVLTRKFIPDAPETGQVVFSQQAYALGLALAFVVGVIVLGGSPMPTALTPLGLVSAIASGSPVLRRRVLVLPWRAAARPRVAGGGLLLHDPDRRPRRLGRHPGRASRAAPMGRRRRRARLDRDHLLARSSPGRAIAGDRAGRLTPIQLRGCCPAALRRPSRTPRAEPSIPADSRRPSPLPRRHAPPSRYGADRHACHRALR